VSVGSTPTIVLADSFNEEITEVRPGNYVFYDYTQVALGTCKVSDCALTVLASIVGTYPDRIVIDAGATALSKDQGPRQISPNCGYGQVMADYEEGLLARSATIDSITQEHARISVPEDSRIHYKINDVIRILPNHSCLAANLFDEYVVLEGERIKARWRTRCIQRLAT
jgi:D-serine deaminase-like pyridoxal phosphate-dependent protein